MKFISMRLTKTDTEMAIRLSKIYSQMKYRRVEDLVKQAASEQIVLHNRSHVQNEPHTTIQTCAYRYYINPECLLLISYIFMRDSSFSIN